LLVFKRGGGKEGKILSIWLFGGIGKKGKKERLCQRKGGEGGIAPLPGRKKRGEGKEKGEGSYGICVSMLMVKGEKKEGAGKTPLFRLSLFSLRGGGGRGEC